MGLGWGAAGHVWFLSLRMFLRCIHVVALSDLHSFLSSNIPPYSYTYNTLPFYYLIDIWVVSIFGLLWILLQWTLMYESLYGQMFSFLLGRYLGVEFLGHTIHVSNFLRTCQMVFRSSCIILHSISIMSFFPYPHQHLLSIIFIRKNKGKYFKAETTYSCHFLPHYTFYM